MDCGYFCAPYISLSDVPNRQIDAPNPPAWIEEYELELDSQFDEKPEPNIVEWKKEGF